VCRGVVHEDCQMFFGLFSVLDGDGHGVTSEFVAPLPCTSTIISL